MEGAREKIEGLKYYNEKLDLWLATVENAPPDQLIGVTAEEREAIKHLKDETTLLEEELVDLQRKIVDKEKEAADISKKTILAKFAVASNIVSDEAMQLVAGSAKGSGKAGEALSGNAGESKVEALEQVLELVLAEEERARRRVVEKGLVKDLKRYLKTQKLLKEKEDLLLKQLEDKENILQKLRDDLCDVDLGAVPPEEKERAELYVKWKKTLAEKNRYERDLRKGKYLSEKRESTRQQVQLVIAEMERNAEIVHMEKRCKSHEREIALTKEKIERIETAMSGAADAMRRFRADFEQLRVAIMLDKSIKSTQYAALAQHKKRLEQAEGWYQECISVEKERIRKEESVKWQRRLDRAKDHAGKSLELEQQQQKEKLVEVKDRLTKRYFEAFQPLLDEAFEKLESERKDAAGLEKELRDKENELKRCEDEIKDLEEAQSSNIDPSPEETAKFSHELKRASDELKQLWDDLNISVEEKVAFYSELDLISPYNSRVHEMYEQVLEDLEGTPMIGA